MKKKFLGIKCKKAKAQELIEFLKSAKLYSNSFKPFSEGKEIFIPLRKEISKEKMEEIGAKLKKAKINFSFAKAGFEIAEKKPRNLKEALKGKLSEKEFEYLVSSFDSIGKIAVIEIPKELEKKEKLIGGALLEVCPQIETVCKISSAHKGKYRIQQIKFIAGKKTFLTTHREWGCSFLLDISKVFFSPRLSTERQRICRQIKKGETIAALFAGVGPFPIIFAKHSQMQKAFAVELNPVACKYMKENISLNKVESKVEAIKGDVKKIAPKMLAGKCNRAVMPLPRGAETFLEAAISCIKKEGGIIHFYQFSPRENPFEEPIKKIAEACKKMRRKHRILFKRQVRAFSASTVQIVIDFKVY